MIRQVLRLILVKAEGFSCYVAINQLSQYYNQNHNYPSLTYRLSCTIEHKSYRFHKNNPRFISEQLQMNRIQSLIMSQKNKPRRFDQLVQNPIPYLNECNRMEIIEFILSLEQQNKQLDKNLQQMFPGLTPEQIEEKSAKKQLSKKYIAIHKESIEKIEFETSFKIRQMAQIKTKTQALEAQSTQLQLRFGVIQNEMIRTEKERRKLQYDYKEKMKREEGIDVSELMDNMYNELRGILDSSVHLKK